MGHVAWEISLLFLHCYGNITSDIIINSNSIDNTHNNAGSDMHNEISG